MCISFWMKNGFNSYSNFGVSQHRSFKIYIKTDDKEQGTLNDALYHRDLQPEECKPFPSLTIANVKSIVC